MRHSYSHKSMNTPSPPARAIRTMAITIVKVLCPECLVSTTCTDVCPEFNKIYMTSLEKIKEAGDMEEKDILTMIRFLKHTTMNREIPYEGS